MYQITDYNNFFKKEITALNLFPGKIKIINLFFCEINTPNNAVLFPRQPKKCYHDFSSLQKNMNNDFGVKDNDFNYFFQARNLNLFHWTK